MFKYLWAIIILIIFSVWVFIKVKKFATDFRDRYTSWKDFLSKNKEEIKWAIIIILTILLIIITILSFCDFLAYYEVELN